MVLYRFSSPPPKENHFRKSLSGHDLRTKNGGKPPFLSPPHPLRVEEEREALRPEIFRAPKTLFGEGR